MEQRGTRDDAPMELRAEREREREREGSREQNHKTLAPYIGVTREIRSNSNTICNRKKIM